MTSQSYGFGNTYGLHRPTMCCPKDSAVIGLQENPWRYIIWDTKCLKITPWFGIYEVKETSFRNIIRALK